LLLLIAVSGYTNGVHRQWFIIVIITTTIAYAACFVFSKGKDRGGNSCIEQFHGVNRLLLRVVDIAVAVVPSVSISEPMRQPHESGFRLSHCFHPQGNLCRSTPKEHAGRNCCCGSITALEEIKHQVG
jgi:hypothetical protein